MMHDKQMCTSVYDSDDDDDKGNGRRCVRGCVRNLGCAWLLPITFIARIRWGDGDVNNG